MGAFMAFLFLALLIFFAVRAVLYFRNGRAVAGIFASFACLLFTGGIYVDYAKSTGANAEVARSAD